MWSTQIEAGAGRAAERGARGPIEDSYDGWQQADTAARAIEREVKETWRRYERGVGAPPSSALLREAACLRHAARERLGEMVGLLQGAVGTVQGGLHARPGLSN